MLSERGVNPLQTMKEDAEAKQVQYREAWALEQQLLYKNTIKEYAGRPSSKQ
jgi:hypothetical protein